MAAKQRPDPPRARGHVAVGLLLATILAGCRPAVEESGPPPPPRVIVAQPIVRPIVEWDEYTGRLEAVAAVEVRSRVSGYLQSIHFTEGEIVAAGALLFIVDPRPYAAEVRRAEANVSEARARREQADAQVTQAEAEQKRAAASLELARRRLERTKSLVERNVETQEDLDIRESEFLQAQAEADATTAQIASAEAAAATAAAAIETAQAQLDGAKLELDYTKIRAPIAGRVSRRLVTEGNLIEGGGPVATPLTSIVSLDPIHFYFDADEQSFLKYARLAREGKRQSSRDVRNPVFLALADESGYPHSGHMDFVDNRLDAGTGTMRGRAILPNADLSLTPGLFARLRLPGSGRYEAVLIPDTAVGFDQAEQFVYVVGTDDVARAASGEAGRRGARLADRAGRALRR